MLNMYTIILFTELLLFSTSREIHGVLFAALEGGVILVSPSYSASYLLFRFDSYLRLLLFCWQR